jgi:hypothetical protein
MRASGAPPGASSCTTRLGAMGGMDDAFACATGDGATGDGATGDAARAVDARAGGATGDDAKADGPRGDGATGDGPTGDGAGGGTDLRPTGAGAFDSSVALSAASPCASRCPHVTQNRRPRWLRLPQSGQVMRSSCGASLFREKWISGAGGRCGGSDAGAAGVGCVVGAERACAPLSTRGGTPCGGVGVARRGASFCPHS